MNQADHEKTIQGQIQLSSQRISSGRTEALLENNRRSIFEKENEIKIQQLQKSELESIEIDYEGSERVQHQQQKIKQLPPNTLRTADHSRQILNIPRQSIDLNYLSPSGVIKKRSPILHRRSGVKFGFNDVWKKGALRIIYIITKFLQILRTSTHKYKFKLMNEKMLTIVNDISADYDFYLINNLLREKPNRLQKAKHYLLTIKQKYQLKLNFQFYVLQPDSGFKILWDMLVLIVIILNIFYIPMKLSFNLTSNNSFLDVAFDQLPSWLFVMDIILKFNTAYYKEGVKYEKRKKIFRNYIYGDFMWDLIVVIPFLISRFNLPYIDFILLLRVTRVSSMFENIEDITSIREKFATILDLVKLIYVNIFISHICACAWHYVGVIELNHYYSDKIWIVRQNLVDSSAQTRYIYSFYWSTITTFTVGYGDITAETEIEMMFIIITLFLTSIVFGYTISNIGSIFSSLKEKNDTFKNNMAQMNNYIKRRIKSQQLQMKVRKYFENYFKSQQKQECEQFLDNLSEELKQEVSKDMYKPILMGCKILKENFSESFLDELCTKVQRQKFNQGERVFSSGELTNKLYFILSGELRIFYQNNKGIIILTNILEKNKSKRQCLRSYKPGYFIGTKNFIINQQTEYSAYTTKFSEIAYLNWSDFMNIIQEYPSDIETYSLIRDNLIYNPYFKKVIDVCAICLSNHNFKKCPFVFYIPNRDKLLSDKKKKLEENERKDFLRQTQSQRSLEQRELYQEKALCSAIDLGLLKEQEVDQDFLIRVGLAFSEKQIIENDTNSQNKQKIYEIQSKESFSRQVPETNLIQQSNNSVIKIIRQEESECNSQRNHLQQARTFKKKQSDHLSPSQDQIKYNEERRISRSNFRRNSHQGKKRNSQIYNLPLKLNIQQQQQTALTQNQQKIESIKEEMDYIELEIKENQAKEYQLDILKKEYLSQLIEDKEYIIDNKEVQFEVAKNFQFYYGTYNLHIVLSKLGLHIQNSQNLLRKDNKIKSHLSNKIKNYKSKVYS